MATQVQLRRGTAAQNDSFTGAAGELTFDTTNKRVRIHDGSTAGGFELKTENSSGDTLFADNEKAIFGAGNDLQIYHGGNHSFISEQGTGNLKILADSLVMKNAADTENYITGTSGGAAALYYAGSEKLATTSTGIDVTGTVTADGLDLKIADVSKSWSTYAGTLATLENNSGNGAILQFVSNPAYTGEVWFGDDASRNQGRIRYDHSADMMAFWTNASEKMRIDSSGNLLVGKTSPTISTTGVELRPNGQLFATQDGNYPLLLNRTTSDGDIAQFRKDGSTVGSIGSNSSGGQPLLDINASTTGSSQMRFTTSGSEAMRIDSSGNLLVGTTDATPYDNTTGEGIALKGDNIQVARQSATPMFINRMGTDGDLVDFRKDGATVGSIGSYAGAELVIGTDETGLLFGDGGNNILPYDVGATPTRRDDAISFGNANYRFKDLYLSGGVYLGGTGASNQLDDYEEGTFTPSAVSGVTGFSTTYSRYVKIGQLVFINFYIHSFVSPSSNQLKIGNLPFSVRSNGYAGSNFETGADGDFGYARTNTASNQLFCYKHNPTTNHRETYLGNDLGGHLILSLSYLTD